ncbi:DUF202 domain-containing protein [Saccharomonospora sp. CUA-673]|uniref:DUF202 domain-containing protein n=1 Tax=Saccharomonospora sp. CUA-673 TaxID=1904969 RepID=UPI00096A68BB|nr:DUF202 domain-containing protein [Saccharomonospora sp. CUA-673]
MNEAQPERTGLAWQRTALASAACTGLLVHSAVTHGSAVLSTAAPVAVLSTAVLSIAGLARSRALRSGTPPLHAGVAATATVLVALTALAGLVAILVPH